MGRVDTRYVGGQEVHGQVINLGAAECLTMGKILHETLHALGLQADLCPVYCILCVQVLHMR